MQENVEPKSELWSLSLRDLFYKYIRFLPVFLLSVAFCLFASYLYLRYTVRVYSSTGTLHIQSEAPNARTDKFEDIFMSNRTNNIQSEIEILKSKPLMERVVRRLNLHATYLAKGRFITTNIYKFGPFLLEVNDMPDSTIAFTLNIKFLNDHEFRVNNDPVTIRFGQLFRNQFGTFKLVRNQQVPVGKDYIVIYQPTSSAARGLVGPVQVTPRATTGILNISYQGANPQMCADIINGLMDEYDEYSIEQKNISADQSLAFIDGRMSIIRRELDSVQDLMLDYQQRSNLIDPENQSSEYFNKISETDKLINEAQFNISVADLIGDYLRDKKNEHNRVIVPSNLGLDDPVLGGLIGEYNKLQIERKGLLESNIPEGNPSVVSVTEGIEILRERILESIRNIKAAFNKNITELKRKSGAAQGQLRALPTKIKEYLELKRQVETKEGLFNILQAKREETAIGRASTISSSKVIDRAGSSSVPIKPNKKAIRLMAIVLGLALPAMFIFISEVLNDKISTRYDIEKITPTPIIGEIGHSYSESALIVTRTTRSMVAEQFRIIRSNLQYILNNADKATILVTSSFSGEGKSFITTNMGAVLALAGKKTVILEFDIRKPKILAGMNMAKRPGITNYLVGKAKVDELLIQVPEYDNLFIMACGPVPPNPSELLLDSKVAELFTELKSRFDVVIVDTAPVGMVSDAQTLGKFADCTLYLVRQGHTFKKQVALIDEFYQENKLPKVSIIINDVKVKPGYGYYGYGRYGYGYGYGYGSYYEEETPPKTVFDKVLSWFDIGRILKRSRKA
jgi:tyrosine-protein kinase Etk/Wzc